MRRVTQDGFSATLHLLLAGCAALPRHPAGKGALLLGMAALGASGSVAHCAPMCGPLVAGQVMARLACLPCARLSLAARLRHGVLPLYHLGRLCTYAALGAAAGALGAGVLAALAPARAALLLLAAAMALLAAARLAGTATPGAGRAARLLSPMVRRLRPGGFAYGLALGLLPCGLLYAALLAASASGSPWRGAAAMAAFGAGTLPILALLGAGAHRIPPAWRRLAPLLLATNAAILLVAALTGVFA